MDVTAVGQALAGARRAGAKLAAYPGYKPSMEQAQAIQNAMAAAMGAPVVGWKVGLTSQKAQELCGVEAPLAGPLFEGDVTPSGAEWALLSGDLGIIEAEIGFRMAADLPARAAPYQRAEVLAAAGEVLPVFEWVNKRLPGDLREAPEWLLADGVINRGLIHGAGVEFDAGMDLAAETVTVTRDGAVVTEGVGANALGDPAAVLVWLANALSAQGKGVRAGDLVATGLICDVATAAPGRRFEALFSSIGAVSLRVV